MRTCQFFIGAAALYLLATPAAFAAPPPNDDFDSAVPILGVPAGPFSVNNAEATTAADDPVGGCFGPTRTVWYSFTATQNDRIQMDTYLTDSGVDTTLSVWTGERGNLVEVACNDDAPFPNSRVRFDASAGETYYVMLGLCCGGPDDEAVGGEIRLSLTFAPPLPTVEVSLGPVGSFDNRSGNATVRGTVRCLNADEVFISGLVNQTKGRLKISGFFFDSFVGCDGTSRPWSALAIDDNAKFGGGKADASVSAEVFSEGEGAFDQDARRITLRGN